MPPRRRKRLDPSAFALPVEQIRQGFYSDVSLARARAVLRADKHSPRVLTQVSGVRAGYLGGIDECVALLKLCADDWGALVVNALYEGDRYDDWDTVLAIEGPYDAFVHLENLYRGLLARRTRVCTNARLVMEAAGSKPVFMFGAREDLFFAQPGDGYSAQVGGIKQVSTPAQASLLVGPLGGTIPRGLIASYNGNSVVAAKRFAEHVGEDVQLIALVDYQNDCVKASLDVARALESRLWGVRLDTDENLVDHSVVSQMGTFPPAGVNPQLVWNVRNALDTDGFGDVKIVVSGGFTAERIRSFEESGVPVDAYGVGAALYQGRFDFAADIVQVNGKSQARAGRELRVNPRMERVK